jgi:histone deacetylase 1/2
MKPFRVKMTDTLVKCYGMDKKMENMRADEDYIESVDLTKFHSDDYVDCLRNISIAKKSEYID